MLSFNKLKAFLCAICILFSIAFLLVSIAVISQNQPSNIIFLALTSSALSACCAAVFGYELINESRTLSSTVYIKNGTPVDIESLDIEDVHILSLNQRLNRGKLTNRELTAHIIHYYEQRKTLGAIRKNSLLQINFLEQPDEANTAKKTLKMMN